MIPSRDASPRSPIRCLALIDAFIVTFLVLAHPAAHAQACDPSLSPSAINPSGSIAGGLAGAGFVRARDGSITTFLVDGQRPVVVDINPSGTITGFYIDATLQINRGYVRAADGSITSFQVPEAIDTRPWAINPAGTVVGSYELPDDFTRSYGFLRYADGPIL